MKIVTLKSFLWFLVTLLLAFSFPIQVGLASPIPSLFPYLGIVFIYALTLSSKLHTGLKRWNTREPITLMISIYLLLVLFQTGSQTVFGFISWEMGASALVIFFLPVTYFIYFRSVATNQEIRSVFFAIALAGFVIGLYFFYDSYSMIVSGQLNDFSLHAFKYSELRAPSQEINSARISAGSRSHGLLENSYVSAAWIVLGCVSSLTLLPNHAIVKRTIVIVMYGTLLLAGLSFTSIAGFAFVLFLIEFQWITLFRGRISIRGTKLMIVVSVGFLLFFALLFGFIFDDMLQQIKKFMMNHVDFAVGTITVGEDKKSFLKILVLALISTPVDMLLYNPSVLLIGDGFSVFVALQGGDMGIIGSIYRFGLPFFIAIIMGLISLMRRAFNQIRLIAPEQSLCARYLFFSACVTVYLLFTEIHCTVWSAKSVMPIFFLALALYQRCLLPRGSKIPVNVMRMEQRETPNTKTPPVGRVLASSEN